MSEPTQEQPAISPAVSTAPAGPRSRWSRIPDHLGRARTSTVVLAVLFVALFTLYLYVKPDNPATTTTGTNEPAPVSTPARAPQTSETPTSEVPATTTPEEPTPTRQPTTSAVPSDTTAPETTTGSPSPSAEPSSPVGPVPTTAVPTD